MNLFFKFLPNLSPKPLFFLPQNSQHFVRDAVYAFAHALHTLSANSCATNDAFLCKNFKKRVYFDLADFLSEVRSLPFDFSWYLFMLRVIKYSAIKTFLRLFS